MNIKLAAGLFYTKKGFLSIGYNSARTYVDKKITSNLHAECSAIRNYKFNNRIKTKNLKLIVIRLSPGNQLLNSKPCINCTKTISEYGIRKVYFFNENNEFSCEKTEQILSFHNKYQYITHTDIWFHRVSNRNNAALPSIKKLNLESKDKRLFTLEMGKKISMLRETKSLTQFDLAKRLCVNVIIIKSIEEGTYKYDGHILLKLKKIFGIEQFL